MNSLSTTQSNRQRRTYRVRSVLGNRPAGVRPRLSVKISNMHVSAQIIDDEKAATLAYATTVGAKKDGTLTEKAAWVGGEISKKAKKAGVKKITFDRGSRKYHGRIKALADEARAGGLEF